MRQGSAFAAEHDDFIHDVAYDHYGKRLATASADHKVKVWSETTSGEWQCDGELGSHSAAVYKLAWAHPEFGQVLASCSFDQSVRIWEALDNPSVVIDDVEADATGSERQRPTERLVSWECAHEIQNKRVEVNDLQFAPRHFGLSLATCASDGKVSIFTADDVMNLKSWRVSDSFAVAKSGAEATCLSWNPSRFESQMLVVGCASKSVSVWAKNQDARRWDRVVDFPTDADPNDVSWAPNLGRSYHLIAVANGNKVDIWRLMWSAEKNSYCEFKRDAELMSNTEVWRCEWNITGTVLATSGDSGTITLWRKNFQNQWNRIAEESLAA
mmetsp:Transcript_8945/g.22761  ORF Transcript_8945/g.22761 Transcript_8945/m.22761 type:complete len:327 (+) Transcript_8945:197-1177(+)